MTAAVNIITTILLIPWGGIVMMSPMMVAAGGFKDKLTNIVTAMLLMGYPAILFTACKLLSINYFGIQPGTWLIGFSLVIGFIFLLYGLPKMVLNLLTGIPNSGYFISTSGVYLEGSKIKKAKRESFETIKEDSRYAKDNSHVFYNGQIIESADPKSFRAINNNNGNDAQQNLIPVFWKDQSNVFHQNKMIASAEPETFQHIRGHYGRDAKHVYYFNNILKHAQPNTFRFLNVNMAVDASSVFIIDTRSETPVDIKTFEIVKNDFTDFFKDKDNIYLVLYNRKGALIKVEGAHRNTFTMLEQNYAKDKNHVYYFGYNAQNKQKLVTLEEANPETFIVDYSRGIQADAHDDTRVFLRGEVV